MSVFLSNNINIHVSKQISMPLKKCDFGTRQPCFSFCGIDKSNAKQEDSAKCVGAAYIGIFAAASFLLALVAALFKKKKTKADLLAFFKKALMKNNQILADETINKKEEKLFKKLQKSNSKLKDKIDAKTMKSLKDKIEIRKKIRYINSLYSSSISLSPYAMPGELINKLNFKDEDGEIVKEIYNYNFKKIKEKFEKLSLKENKTQFDIERIENCSYLIKAYNDSSLLNTQKSHENCLKYVKFENEGLKKLFESQKSKFLSQGSSMGDCYLVATLNGILMNKNAFEKFLKMFEIKGNDVVLKFSDGFDVVFENSSLKSDAFLKNASVGFEMFEQAYLIKRMSDILKNAQEYFAFDEEFKTLQNQVFSLCKKNDKFSETTEHFVSFVNKHQKKFGLKFEKVKDILKSGMLDEVSKSISNEFESKILPLKGIDLKANEKRLSKKEINKIDIYEVLRQAFKKSQTVVAIVEKQTSGFCPHHVYTIYFDPKNKMVSVINSNKAQNVCHISLEEFVNTFGLIHIFG